MPKKVVLVNASISILGTSIQATDDEEMSLM
jgi:hypothetical protein